jgi:hypothetical protein
MEVLLEKEVARIRELNDAFRTSFRGGQILLTEGVASLPPMVIASVLQKVAEFNDWRPEIHPRPRCGPVAQDSAPAPRRGAVLSAPSKNPLLDHAREVAVRIFR